MQLVWKEVGSLMWMYNQTQFIRVVFRSQGLGNYKQRHSMELPTTPQQFSGLTRTYNLLHVYFKANMVYIYIVITVFIVPLYFKMLNLDWRCNFWEHTKKVFLIGEYGEHKEVEHKIGTCWHGYNWISVRHNLKFLPL